MPTETVARYLVVGESGLEYRKGNGEPINLAELNGKTFRVIVDSAQRLVLMSDE